MEMYKNHWYGRDKYSRKGPAPRIIREDRGDRARRSDSGRWSNRRRKQPRNSGTRDLRVPARLWRVDLRPGVHGPHTLSGPGLTDLPAAFPWSLRVTPPIRNLTLLRLIPILGLNSSARVTHLGAPLIPALHRRISGLLMPLPTTTRAKVLLMKFQRRRKQKISLRVAR